MAEPLKASQVMMEAPAPSVREQRIAEITAAQRTTHADLFRRGTCRRPGNPVPDRVAHYDFRLGTVFLSSGMGQTSSSLGALDLALVYPDPARLPEVFVDQLSNDPPPSAYSFSQGKGHCADEVDAENKADVRFTQTFPDAGRISFLSRELVVLDETPDSRFANFGDSGAVIRNGTAVMVGMVWGGIEPRRFDDGEAVVVGPNRWPLRLSAITLCLPMEPLLEAMQAEIDKNFPGETVKLSPLPNSFGSSV
ncbi:hypothetical protein C8A01DRAFT_33645 [Parachaetomium inaequale]|uniref:Uncharacterized protein n=1 Tax=Parachaetomium inaequale TaxID=2588326 RepID=A0AAN6PK03_9PEZI|nr:hypothetical protein C8A01DRAFT_33645 [Parachaetomium inaequale]